MQGLNEPIVLVPEVIAVGTRTILDAYKALDGCDYACTITPCKVGSRAFQILSACFLLSLPQGPAVRLQYATSQVHPPELAVSQAICISDCVMPSEDFQLYGANCTPIQRKHTFGFNAFRAGLRAPTLSSRHWNPFFSRTNLLTPSQSICLGAVWER